MFASGSYSREFALCLVANRSQEIKLSMLSALSTSLPIVYLGGGIIQEESLHSERDFRQLMQHDSLAAIVIGTPDHWHAIPAILDCQSGKDLSVCGGRLFFYGIEHLREPLADSECGLGKRVRNLYFVRWGALRVLILRLLL